MRQEIIKLTKKLIEFRTTEDCPEEKDRCFKFTQNYFKGSSAVIKRVGNQFCKAIVISNSKIKRVDLMLNGHIDAVEGKDDQFRPILKDGRIYGRGAIDMKGAVAVMMYFMKQVVSRKLNKSIALMIVGDEEIPFTNSTQYMLKEIGFRPKFTIVGEETGFDIVVRQKGSLNLILEYSGLLAHSAFPREGINAVEKLILGFNELAGLKVFNQGGDFSSSINLSALNGGAAINSVPDSAMMKVNIRFVNRSELGIILKKIKTMELRDRRLRALIYERGGVMKCGNCKKQLLDLRQSVIKVVTKRPRLIKTSTSSDARFFTEQKQPVVVFGPKGKNYHKANEYVEILSLEQYFRILENLSLNY